MGGSHRARGCWQQEDHSSQVRSLFNANVVKLELGLHFGPGSVNTSNLNFLHISSVNNVECESA